MFRMIPGLSAPQEGIEPPTKRVGVQETLGH